MPKIERAVIVAAGVGKRLRPLTLTTPKPLIAVQGIPMIETGIRGLRQNGVEEIYVVTGHLGDQFGYLTALYPGLTLIENPYYQTCNNISSLYVARAHLENAFVMEGDLIIRNAAILSRDFTHSGYLAQRTPTPPEWSLTVENDRIINCNIAGGQGTHRLMGVSLWTQEDGRRLSALVETAFLGGAKDIYWDELALFSHRDDFHLYIRQIAPEDITEIDTVTELCALDPHYLPYEGIKGA
jgi:CTP:phosphocholine cytidylyltransferase-like protein